VLLEYWLGEKRSYLWMVSASAVEAHVLADRATLEAAARQLRAHVLARPGAEVPMEQLARYEEAARLGIEGEVQSLGAMLLDPVARALRGKRIIIVADGALQLLPFGLLSVDGEPLGATHELAYLPSVTTLRWLRREAPASGPRRLAVFADPVFRADDPRLQRPAAPPIVAQSGILRAAADVNLSELPRLPYSRREAEALARLDPGRAPWLALDFDASREAVLKARWDAYGILHFATHALLDLRHPDLSGVVLSLYDSQGRPQDGYLRMNDIYRLNLPADLVVLSACESALGREVAAEGVYSLARAFFYAGTARVLGSLWAVDDAASAEFMARFYRALLVPGGRAAAALRAAQASMAGDARWSAPYYWAGYVLQGDGR
jgi:CHAT domain-containing protein